MCTGHSLHLKNKVTTCVKSCPALYNSSATFNMSHLATLRRGQHLYSKSVMECLPKMFAKLKKKKTKTKPRLKAALGSGKRGWQQGCFWKLLGEGYSVKEAGEGMILSPVCQNKARVMLMGCCNTDKSWEISELRKGFFSDFFFIKGILLYSW